jgi:hypothetical protein
VFRSAVSDAGGTQPLLRPALTKRHNKEQDSERLIVGVVGPDITHHFRPSGFYKELTAVLPYRLQQL